MSGTWILPKQLHTSAYVQDTAALSLDCVESSEICERLLFVRSKHSPSAIWLRKWRRDTWTRHLFGRILKLSHTKHFTDAWIFSLADTHASHSQPQESDSAKTTRAIFGRISQGEFDFSSPDSASLKTSKDISAWGCPTSSKTWQEWVTERRGAYSARLNAARHTSGSGCSSWPTPQVGEEKVCMTGSQNQRMLSHAVMDGPPVPASSSMDGSRPELWRTPSVGEEKNQCSSTQIYLQNQVGATPKHWRTPDASDRRSDKSTQIGLRNQVSGKLNPRWVETLMGLPVGWTMPSCVSPVTIERMNSDCSVTESCQQPPLSHSEL